MNLRRPTLLFATILSLAPLRGQEILHWPGIQSAPNAVLIPFDANNIDVYISGFATLTTATDGGEVGAGVGTTPGSARTVTKAEFKKETDNSEVQATPLFAFTPNANTTLGFARKVPGLTWHGFHATASRTGPGFRPGTLRFRFFSTSPITLADFRSQLTNWAVAVAETDSAGNVLNTPRLVAIRPVVTPMPLLHYKFERGAGNLTLNYVERFAGAPRHGRMSAKAAWTTGKFGGALRGGDATTHHSCDTDWHGGLHGSFTVAFWLKQGNAPATSTSHICRGPGKFAIFAPASPAKGLQCTDWAAGTQPLTLPDDIQAMAQTDHVHVALVLDKPANKATWYVNGQPRRVESLGGKTPSLPASPTSLVFGGQPGEPNFYDLDTIRLVPFAVRSPAVRSWAQRETAVAANYGDSSGCLLEAKAGPPTAGRPGFELHIVGPASSTFAMVVGRPIATPFGIAGADWYVDLNGALTFFAKTSGIGQHRMTFTVPTSLKGITLHTQVYLDPGATARVSRPLALSVE